jgi:hypothetical protein
MYQKIRYRMIPLPISLYAFSYRPVHIPLLSFPIQNLIRDARRDDISLASDS